MASELLAARLAVHVSLVQLVLARLRDFTLEAIMMRKAIAQEGVKDPFAGYAGVPMFSGVKGPQRYLGRVVFEIWQASPRAESEGAGLALLVDPATTDVAGPRLLELVRDGIGARIEAGS